MYLDLKRTLLRAPLTASILLVSAMVPLQAHAEQNAVLGLNNEGVKEMNAGRFDRAIQKFEEALQEDATYSLACENLAIAHNNYGLMLAKKKESLPLALVHFRQAFFVNSKNETTRENVENTIQLMGKNYKSFEDRVGLGNKAKEQNDFVSAVVEYSEALKLKKDDGIQSSLTDATNKLANQGHAPYSDIAKKILNRMPRPENSSSSTLSRFPNQYFALLFDVQRKIKKIWSPPADVQSRRTIVKFTVGPTGSVSNVQISDSSGSVFADSEALRCVNDASPFMAYGHRILEPTNLEFSFDYNVFSGGSLPQRKPGILQVEFNLAPPKKEDLTALAEIERGFINKAFTVAESYEQFGQLDDACKLYEQVLLQQEGVSWTDQKEVARIRLALERVKTYQAASKINNGNELKPLLFKCLANLTIDNSITRFTSLGLQKQLIDDAVRCKINLLDLAAELKETQLPISIKYSVTGLIQLAAEKQTDTAEHIQSIKARKEGYLASLETLALADDATDAAFRQEKNGAYEEALLYYKQALIMKRKCLGPGSGDALMLEGFIARILAKQGKVDQSRKAYESALAAFRKGGNLDYQYVRFLEQYADDLAQNKIEPRATQVYEEAVAAWKKTNSN